MYEQLRRHRGEVFRALAEQKQCRILGGQRMPDHIPILTSIPPKRAVSAVVGFIKGQNALLVSADNNADTGPRRGGPVLRTAPAGRVLDSTLLRPERCRWKPP